MPSQRCLLLLALCACRPCGDARAADAVIVVVVCINHAAANKCRAVARHILPGSRGHEGLAALCPVVGTVSSPSAHGMVRPCVELFGSAATRVCTLFLCVCGVCVLCSERDRIGSEKKKHVLSVGRELVYSLELEKGLSWLSV